MADFSGELPVHIGPYRVLQQLGRGGMGAVYEAEEVGPVRRRVAVKVVQTGLNSRDIIARFEAERQALALMNHPGIAKVFQAGTTDAGLPFFSMELVHGLPITEYCDARRLSVNERLELFIDVCRAVQHAHQKSVVHRDLKPSNVLVTEQEGARQPKIIDFGVAKALGQQLTEHTLVTLAGTAIGTAAYMSPEQADPASADVDTRSDIYSLGVMLYELLTGRLPMVAGSEGVHAFLARIASGQTNTPLPSEHVTGHNDSTTVAYTRSTDPKHLQRELRGDLDWIVLMAMNPDRAHRYATANSLAEDLRRHLDHEPVVARPPSTRYRIQKFVRRHRMGVTAAGFISTAIVVGVVLATVGFVRATRAERVAAQNAAAAQQVTAFLVGLFKVNDPGESRGNTLTAREILDRGTKGVQTELAAQPLLQARLMLTLGTVHQQLGLYKEARPLLDTAERVLDRELGPRHVDVADALMALGDNARETRDLAVADSAYQRALDIRTAAFGPDNVQVASSIASLAALRYLQGRLSAAESLYTRVLPLEDRLGADDAQRARHLRGLGVVYWAQGRLTDAETIFKRALALQEHALGPDHFDVAGTLNNLGGTYYQMGRYDEALQYYERARPVLEKSLAPEHSTVIALHNNIGETYWKLKRYKEAEPFLRDALTAKEKTLAANDAKIATTLHALAGLLRDEGRYRDAEPLYRRAISIRELTVKTNPIPLTETLRDYAELLRRSGRVAEGARLEARADSLRPAK